MKLKAEVAVFAVLMVFVLNVSANKLRLVPDDPHQVVGSNLQLNCTLSSTAKYTSQDIEFEYSLIDPRRQEFVLEREKTELNRRTLQLNHANITEEFDRATITCYIRQNRQIASSQIIRVGYKPGIPVITSYKVDQSKNGKFEFKWRTNVSDHRIRTHYIAWYKTRDQREFRSCEVCNGETAKCPVQRDFTCTIPYALEMVHPDGEFHFKVNASNKLGKAESEHLVKDLFYLVQPARVRSAHVLDNGSTPVVFFTGPRVQRSYASDYFYYNVSVTCNTADNFTKQYGLIRSKSSQNNVTLTGLPDYTWCVVSVVRKTDYINLEYGFWSDPVVAAFRSQEGVPLSAPEICTSCFHVLPSTQPNLREVIVYFKYLDEYNTRGKVHRYRPCSVVSSVDSSSRHDNNVLQLLPICSEASHDTVGSSDGIDTSVRLKLSTSHEYRVAVIGATSAGFNTSLKITRGVKIPHASDVLAGPQNLTVITQKDGTVDVSWSKDEDATSYTVVWCIMSDTSDRVSCKVSANDSVNWRVLDSKQSRYTVRGLTKPATSYLFGVALEGGQSGMSSSGIVWSDCTYDVQANREPPIVSFEANHEFVDITITKKLCTQSKAFLYAFIIHCYPQGSPSGYRSRYVDHYGKHRVDGLLPDTEYTFVIEPLSVGNPIYQNSTRLVRTQRGPLSAGIIAAIAIGGIFIVVIIGAGVATLLRKFRKLLSCCEDYWINMPIRLPGDDPELKPTGDRKDDPDGQPSDPKSSEFSETNEENERGRYIKAGQLPLLSSSDNRNNNVTTARDCTGTIENDIRLLPTPTPSEETTNTASGDDVSYDSRNSQLEGDELTSVDYGYHNAIPVVVNDRENSMLADVPSEPEDSSYAKCTLNSSFPFSGFQPVVMTRQSSYVAAGGDGESISPAISQRFIDSDDSYQQATIFQHPDDTAAEETIDHSPTSAAAAAIEDSDYTPGYAIGYDQDTDSYSVDLYTSSAQSYDTSAGSEVDPYTVVATAATAAAATGVWQ